MRKAAWNGGLSGTGWLNGAVGAALLFCAQMSMAVEVGLVTAVSAGVKLATETSPAGELKAFIKLREGDRLTLPGSARLQIVFFDGGRQETWQGAGALEVGAASSKAVKGGLQAEVKTLPAILVKQLSKTPSPDGTVKTGMIRMRSISSGGSLETVEKNYADLRAQAVASDHSPELYLLACYFELREFDKLKAVLKTLREKSPGDALPVALDSLYSKAIDGAIGSAATPAEKQ